MNCVEITVKGLVQGIGYRPYVANLLRREGISATVRNTGGIVKIEANIDLQAAEGLVHRLYEFYPEGAIIEDVTISHAYDKEIQGVSIIKSDEDDMSVPFLPVDLPPCKKCQEELRNPGNRRYKYPFISCAVCGPRYSIMKRTPYDRVNTTMASYELCEDCEREYLDCNDSRYYAQTISCHKCGMQLIFEADEAIEVKESAFKKAVQYLRAGEVLAVKDTGGYHFVCDARNHLAVKKLRKIKKRESKPFALVLKNVDTARKLAVVNDREKELLESKQRPIVLLEGRDNEENISKDVNVNSPYVGVMLPSSALFIMLADEFEYLVSTSANYQGSPIIIDDEKIKSFALPMLYHKRQIVTPVDDSIMRVIEGKTQVIRRGRGLVPESFVIDVDAGHTLALGADLKGGFAYASGRKIYMSQYFGDLLKRDNFYEYKAAIHRFIDTLNVKYDKVVADKHILYESSSYAKTLGVRLESVFHHRAHACSVLAENPSVKEAVMFSFDGTGYGENEGIFGGESYFYSCRTIKHTGGLKPVLMTGADNVAQDPALPLFAYIADGKLENDELIKGLGKIIDRARFGRNLPISLADYEIIKRAIGGNINTVLNSSAGRLFDAVAFMLGAGSYNNYEGECPINLEYMAVNQLKKTGGMDQYLESVSNNNFKNGSVSLSIKLSQDNGKYYADTPQLIKDLFDLLRAGVVGEELAVAFHLALANCVADMAEMIFEKENRAKGNVVLSGGCFTNKLLLMLCIRVLEARGMRAVYNHKVAAGDDGIALGQLYHMASGMEDK